MHTGAKPHRLGAGCGDRSLCTTVFNSRPFAFDQKGRARLFHLIKEQRDPPVSTDVAGAAQDRKTDHTRPAFETQNAVIPGTRPGVAAFFVGARSDFCSGLQKVLKKVAARRVKPWARGHTKSLFNISGCAEWGEIFSSCKAKKRRHTLCMASFFNAAGRKKILPDGAHGDFE